MNLISRKDICGDSTNVAVTKSQGVFLPISNLTLMLQSLQRESHSLKVWRRQNFYRKFSEWHRKPTKRILYLSGHVAQVKLATILRWINLLPKMCATSYLILWCMKSKCCNVSDVCPLIRCRVLPCVASCCRVSQCVAVRCIVLQCVALCCSALQCVAVCCSALQCLPGCCSMSDACPLICWHSNIGIVTWANDATPSYVWCHSFICETCLIHMWDVTYSYMRHDLFTRATCLIHTCDMPHSYVCHDSFICVTYVRHESFIRVTWLIYMYNMTHSNVWLNRSYVLYYSFLGEH